MGYVVSATWIAEAGQEGVVVDAVETLTPHLAVDGGGSVLG